MQWSLNSVWFLRKILMRQTLIRIIAVTPCHASIDREITGRESRIFLRSHIHCIDMCCCRKGPTASRDSAATGTHNCLPRNFGRVFIKEAGLHCFDLASMLPIWVHWSFSAALDTASDNAYVGHHSAAPGAFPHGGSVRWRCHNYRNVFYRRGDWNSKSFSIIRRLNIVSLLL